MIVIAIDGPAGSGKSTVAKRVAEALSLSYLDTGAMYRAVALVAQHKKMNLSDAAAMTKVATELKLQLFDDRKNGHIQQRIMVNGLDATAAIRSAATSKGSSEVAVHADVRDRLVRRQRNWVTERDGAVVEGRDIGTVVFPDAMLKVFLTASDEARVARRQGDVSAREFADMTKTDAAAQLVQRDKRDATRVASPMSVADDAVVIDTTQLSVDEVVIEIMKELRARNGGELPKGNRN